MIRILIVNDEFGPRESARLCLSRRSRRIQTAGSNEEALSLRQGESFELLITDLVHPIKDGGEASVSREDDVDPDFDSYAGVELIEDVKQAYPRIKIVVATATPYKQKIAEQVMAYLPPLPFCTEDLMDLIAAEEAAMGAMPREVRHSDDNRGETGGRGVWLAGI